MSMPQVQVKDLGGPEMSPGDWVVGFGTNGVMEKMGARFGSSSDSVVESQGSMLR